MNDSLCFPQPKIANMLLEKLPEFMGDDDDWWVDFSLFNWTEENKVAIEIVLCILSKVIDCALYTWNACKYRDPEKKESPLNIGFSKVGDGSSGLPLK